MKGTVMNYSKRCPKCQQEKPLTSDFFYRDNKRLSGFTPHCKSCKKKNYGQYSERKKKWYQENKSKVIKRTVENRRKKRQSDPLQRVKDALSSNLRNAIKGRTKGQRTLDYLCISIDEFKIYIENQFKEGMNWENYGEWHLDHIQPICSFDHSDEEQIKECWHYSNFQPLWARENSIKSGKH
jgi:hypothetical protein